MLETAPIAAYMRDLYARYERLKAEGLKLDMTRGKPCAQQLNLSNPMLQIDKCYAKDGFDCRNYGYPDGLPEARKLCAAYLGTDPKHTLVLGNSSLELMYKVLAEHKMRGGWPKNPKFICPVPGYDRHFEICRALGIEMIPVSQTPNGPDMGAVRALVKDMDVIGMWCMPLYSNPTGISYHRGVCRDIAELRPKNGRFIVMWDNAYAEHHLGALRHPAVDICELAKQAKTEERFWIFGSFSKVTFASAGLSMLASSESNIAWFRKRLAVQTIGPDKLNQLRHVLFLKNRTGIKKLMRKHAAIIRPKFEAVCEELQATIGGKGIGHWVMPEGGYFISLYLHCGSARRTVELAAGVGLALTPAGAAYPNGNNPVDDHIRIAPTFPALDDVRRAARVLGLCAEIAHRERHPQTRRAVS